MENHEQRRSINTNIHDSSHLGLNRTNDMVARQHYWPGLFKDVRDHVSVTPGHWTHSTRAYFPHDIFNFQPQPHMAFHSYHSYNLTVPFVCTSTFCSSFAPSSCSWNTTSLPQKSVLPSLLLRWRSNLVI